MGLLSSKIVLSIIIIGLLLASIVISNNMVTREKTTLTSHTLITTSTKPTKSITQSTQQAVQSSLITTRLPKEESKTEKTIISFRKFKSYDELQEFIKTSQQEYTLYVRSVSAPFYLTREGIYVIKGVEPIIPIASPARKLAISEEMVPYSKTNIQVVGVDEADIVKTDGKYIYLAILDKVFIIRAYPPKNASILLKLSINQTVQGLYIRENRLIVIASSGKVRGKIKIPSPMPPRTTPIKTSYHISNTTILIYDIANISKPKIMKNITVSGRYIASRMISKYVYVILSAPIGSSERILIPLINGEQIPPFKIGYFEKDVSYVFTIIVALDVESGSYNEEVFLTGASSNIYVSLENLYILSRRWIKPESVIYTLIKNITKVLPSGIRNNIDRLANKTRISIYEKYKIVMEELANWFNSQPKDVREKLYRKLIKIHYSTMENIYREETVVYRFRLNGLNVTAEAKGSVPGYVLDQFSMDEYNGYFRIATTATTYNRSGESFRLITVNNVYILNMSLVIIGKLENIAPGERIYAARYMGNIMYLVTFRRVDPLYGIDLSNPERPRVLGYLKIPGYSEYLHPYKDKYLIGIGYNTDERGKIKGLKVALFNISDVTNIKEISAVVLNKTGLWSPLFKDHKAFLLREDKGYFAFPVRGIENGVYVMEVTNETLKLKGFIVHQQAERILYFGNYIYTIAKSPILVKILSDDTLELVKEIRVEVKG